ASFLADRAEETPKSAGKRAAPWGWPATVLRRPSVRPARSFLGSGRSLVFVGVAGLVEHHASAVYREPVAEGAVVPQELHVAVHEEDVASAGHVIEVRRIVARDFVPHYGQLR